MYFGRKRNVTWGVLLLLVVSAVACMLSVVLVADEMCHRNITTRQPMYPGAEVIESGHNFLRLRGIGVTRMTLATSDDEETVRQWMRQVNMDLLQREQMRGIATVQWQVEPQEERTLIHYYSDCAQ